MSVVTEIQKEREYQDGKWGTAFDDKNTINDWGTYIGVYMARGTTMQASPAEQRAALVKVATLAVAAVEAFDRNGGFAPRHYDVKAGAWTLTGYQEWVRARWAKNPREQDLAIMTLGLCGEAGEVSEPIKKMIRGSGPVDVNALALELGDVIHYATAIADYFGLKLEGIMLNNVAKLETRDLKEYNDKQSKGVI